MTTTTGTTRLHVNRNGDELWAEWDMEGRIELRWSVNPDGGSAEVQDEGPIRVPAQSFEALLEFILEGKPK